MATAFVLLPVERQTAEYVWEPGTDGSAVPLLLIERVPDHFELRFPCAYAAGSEEQLFVSSRSPERVPALFVYGGESRVVIEVPEDRAEPGGPHIRTSVAVPSDADCAVTVRFDRESSTVSLDAANQVAAVAVPSDAFDVTGLHWTTAATDDVRAEVRTSASSMVRNSLLQKIALGGVLLLAVVSLGTTLISARGQRFVRGWRAPLPSEWLMLAVAVIVALVDLPRADDGRILARARLLAGGDLSANVSTLFENRTVPQRWLYEWLLGTVVGWSTNVLVIRLLSVLAVVGAWMLLRRFVLPSLTNGSPSPAVTAAAWTVHAVSVVAWSATLRPEPLVVLLIVVVLAVTASWPAQPRIWPSAVVVAAVALAAATHIAGLAAALAALPAAARALSDLRRSAAPVISGVAWGTAFGLVALFVGSNLRHTLAAAGGFEGDAHGYGPLDTLRYLSTIDNSTAPMMLATGLGLVGAAATIAVVVRWLTGSGHRAASAVVLAAALTPFGLLFTPSKWLWHLAILAPVAFVGWTLIARRFEQRRFPSVAALTLAGAMLGLMTAWAMRPVWNARVLTRWWRDAALRDLSSNAWGDRFPWLIGADVQWWVWVAAVWAVMFAAALLVGSRRMRLSSSAPLAAALLVCGGAVAAVQLTLPVVDAIRSGQEWTFVRQSVVGLVSTDVSCGVPAATPAVVQRAAASARVGAVDGGVAGHSGAYFFAPCHESMHQRDGVWQVPGLLMGQLTNDQRRAAIEYDLEPIGCNSFPVERTEDSLCFTEVVSENDPLTAATVRWHW